MDLSPQSLILNFIKKVHQLYRSSASSLPLSNWLLLQIYQLPSTELIPVAVVK